MPTIELSYSDNGFSPNEAGAVPGDTVTVTNTTAADIDLTFFCDGVDVPLIGLMSPVVVTANGGSASGEVSGETVNLAIAFTANSFEATIDVAQPEHRVTVSPDSNTPVEMTVVPDDGIVFYNESTSDEVVLEIDSPEQDPFGPDIGMNPTLAPLAEIGGFVAAAVSGKKVTVTVKGSTSQPSTINVGSGD